jgi:hypothetical protein
MKAVKPIKHVIIGDSIDSIIKSTFLQLVGEKFFDELINFYDFYKIRGVLEGDILRISMYFEHKNRWEKIAEVNLETKEIKRILDEKILRVYLTNENRYIIENSDKEIQRVTTIILSLVAFILGVGIALVLINLF